MNKLSVALCYTAQVNNDLLTLVRERSHSFGLRAEYLVNVLGQSDGVMNRITLQLGRGYDLVVIVSDESCPRLEYDILGHFNHVLSDPWGTCVMSVCSRDWKTPQPTIAIETTHYLGAYWTDQVPSDLLIALTDHRKKLFDRGLRSAEWEAIRSFATPTEWGLISKLRK